MLTEVLKCVLLDSLVANSTQHVVHKYALAIIDSSFPDFLNMKQEC
jgi:hypothetical protein